MSAKARRRRERHERINERTRRWMQISPATYPFRTLPFPQPFRDLKPILEKEQLLPWPVRQDRLPCRAWHPEHLWELGSLRKAIFNELVGCKDGDKEKSFCRAEYCLEHIFHCWNANLKRYEAVGPAFLIHVLSSRYEREFAFEDEDARQLDALKNASKETNSFQLFLARLHRTAHGSYDKNVMSENTPSLRVHRIACWLEDVIHVRGKEAKIRPRIADIDFLNENHFEDDIPDTSDRDNGHGWDKWIRTAVIIVPNLFWEEFFGHPDNSEDSSSEEEDERRSNLGEEVQQTSEIEDKDEDQDLEEDSSFLDETALHYVLDGQENDEDGSDNPWEADGVREAIQELEDSRTALNGTLC